MDLDWQRLPDPEYRWEVVSGLMQDHAKAVLQYCTTRLGEGMGEEVMQEVFKAAFHQLPKYRPEAPLAAWLFAIARRQCQQVYRNRARRQAIARLFREEIRERAHIGAPPSPEPMVTQKSQTARLAACLTKVRDIDRIVLTLWYWKELPVGDIADIMGKSIAAVRKQLVRAQQRLKELMDDPPPP
jgi:RNA polymerase sigma-70 factor (ECF subfamily)